MEEVIKAFNHEQESLEQVAASAERNRIASQKADFLVNCVNPLIRLLTRMAYVVIAIISGHAMLNGTMTVGVVQAFFQYINQTAEPLTEASYMINSLQAALASATEPSSCWTRLRKFPTLRSRRCWSAPKATSPLNMSALAMTPRRS